MAQQAPAAAAAAIGAAPPRRVACIAGFGVAGISAATARRFGSAGYDVALLARREDRLQIGAEELRAAGVAARGFAVDLSDPRAVRGCLGDVMREMGAPVEVLHWNPYNSVRTPLLEMVADEVDELMGVGVKGLLAAVQELLPHWERMAQQPPAERQPPAQARWRPALLVTGGGLALDSAEAASQAVEWGVEGISIAKAAQHKLVACLTESLRPRGVFVGQVTVLGVVRGTAWQSVRSSAEEEEQDGTGGGQQQQQEELSQRLQREPPQPQQRARPSAAAPAAAAAAGGQAAAGAPAEGGREAASTVKEEASLISPDDVARALWRLFDERPGGAGWRVELRAPAGVEQVE